MWRAALPSHSRQLFVLAFAIVVAVGPAGATSSMRPSAAAPRGADTCAPALPAAVRTATPAQLRWLAARGVTSLVVTSAARKTLSRLSAQARQAHLNVIVPRQRAPRS